MKYWFLLFLPLLTLAGVYDDNASAIIMSRIRQKTVPVTEYMAEDIAKKSPVLHKRGLIGGLKQKLQEYITETYTDKAVKSFEPVMKQEMDNAFGQYYRYTKRDTLLTPEQETHRQKVFADWLSNRLAAKLKNHMINQFELWENDHKRLNKRSELGTQNKDTESFKRPFVEKNGRNMAIFTIVSAFLLIPVFMNPYTIGFYGFIMAIAVFMLFFNPILTRITFGDWI